MRKIISIYPFGRFDVNKKIILLISLILSCVILCSCADSLVRENSSASNSVSSQVGKSAADTIRLLYSSKDSLDPYTCVTEQNADLSQLIFDPLLIINNQYEIEYRLAENVIVDKNVCTINLINAKFSDGTSVTADDIVFSFNKAKKSTTTRHSTALKYAVSAKAENINTVIVTLEKNDPYFANLLTFPIMKKGSDELKDSDKQALVPIGAGRYVFNNQTATLSENQYYYGRRSPIKNILTVDCPDNESVEQTINAGMVDHYFSDLSGNTIPKMNGNSVSILQNRIVFLGINSNHPQLSNSLFRQAISSAINRQEICISAYFGNASPALGPVPSIWNLAEGLLTIEKTSNFDIAQKNIELAGFTEKNKDGFYLLKNNSPITFSLLVNSNNSSRVAAANMIAKSLENIGLKIQINAVSNKQYYSLLRSGRYDLYLGEIRYEDNMDIGGLISLDSAFEFLPAEDTSSNGKNSSKKTSIGSSKKPSNSSKVFSNEQNSEFNSELSSVEEILAPGEITLTSADAYIGFYNGEYTLQDLITAFNAELPVIPICFKNGMVIYSDRFGNGITPSATELFHGIQYLK